LCGPTRKEFQGALGLSLEQWVHLRLGGYIRLDAEVRRAAVAELRSEGLHQAKIAQVLGVAKATISRDINARLAVPNETEPQQPAGEQPLGTFQMKRSRGNLAEVAS
jgi:ParB-like chromosome segregation protein Spo0J